jgi:hypothetical protein
VARISYARKGGSQDGMPADTLHGECRCEGGSRPSMTAGQGLRGRSPCRRLLPQPASVGKPANNASFICHTKNDVATLRNDLLPPFSGSRTRCRSTYFHTRNQGTSYVQLATLWKRSVRFEYPAGVWIPPARRKESMARVLSSGV